jgi:hypothetical protein
LKAGIHVGAERGERARDRVEQPDSKRPLIRGEGGESRGEERETACESERSW